MKPLVGRQLAVAVLVAEQIKAANAGDEPFLNDAKAPFDSSPGLRVGRDAQGGAGARELRARIPASAHGPMAKQVCATDYRDSSLTHPKQQFSF